MPRAINTKDNANSITLADVNKDGVLDLLTTHFESTTGGWYARYGYNYGYGPGPGPYAAERYFAREERFAYNHPYAFARYERRYGW